MEVFRARRARAAAGLDLPPGIRWVSKIDGKIGKKRVDRMDEGRNTIVRTIGDFAYADDTGIAGVAEETFQAENIFDHTHRFRRRPQ